MANGIDVILCRVASGTDVVGVGWQVVLTWWV